MHIKSRELLNILPAIPEHEEHSIFIFIIVLMLLGILGYLFIQHVIPVISTVICDFLKNSYDAAGALSDRPRRRSTFSWNTRNIKPVRFSKRDRLLLKG